MEHPIQYLLLVTRFLDRMIKENGDQIFVTLGLVGIGVCGWILTRPHRHLGHTNHVIIVPIGIPSRHDPEPSIQPPVDERHDS